jgi:hypothetical protein
MEPSEDRGLTYDELMEIYQKTRTQQYGDIGHALSLLMGAPSENRFPPVIEYRSRPPRTVVRGRITIHVDPACFEDVTVDPKPEKSTD